MTNTTWAHWIAIFATAAIAGCGGGDVSDVLPALPTSAKSLTLSESHTQDVASIKNYRPQSTLKPSLVTLSSLPIGTLAPKSATETLGAPTQIGSSRSIAPTSDTKRTTDLLHWQPSTIGGHIAAVTFKSTEAAGVRLGVRVHSLPPTAILRFYSEGNTTALVVPAQEILATIQRNLDSGDLGEDARTYWSTDLGGDSVTMEVEVPPGIATEQVQIAVPRLSHVYVLLPNKETPVAKSIGDSGSCNNDVSCNPEYDAISKSVARMRFVQSGNSYTCTGTLMNNTASNYVPYFLSANHCISSQTVASTLTTDWFYRASACNSAAVSSTTRSITGGAVLLYNSANTDTAFLQLNSTPPTGAVYAGWSSDLQSVGLGMLAVHHPSGDLQKFSIGALSGYYFCSSGSSFSCSTSDSQSGNHFRVTWSSGITESGSSGSGLFVSANGSQYLVGQLHGGSSSCSNTSAPDYYGRFDVAYEAALSRWLAPVVSVARTAVYRFYNTQNGVHFYTSSSAERDSVIATLPFYNYEGVAFYGYGASTTGVSPLYRFYNTRAAAHFYTISDSERDTVRSTLPWYNYEGPSWYASTTSSTGSTAMYRFYNKNTTTHFYTISSGERDIVQQTLPQYVYEGVAYYAWTTQ